MRAAILTLFLLVSAEEFSRDIVYTLVSIAMSQVVGCMSGRSDSGLKGAPLQILGWGCNTELRRRHTDSDTGFGGCERSANRPWEVSSHSLDLASFVFESKQGLQGKRGTEWKFS